MKKLPTEAANISGVESDALRSSKTRRPTLQLSLQSSFVVASFGGVLNARRCRAMDPLYLTPGEIRHMMRWNGRKLLANMADVMDVNN